MTSIVSQWCRNYYKRIQIEKYSKELEDFAKLPSPEEIKCLDQSDHKKQAIKIFSRLSCAVAIPCRKEYGQVRDYLLTYILLDNASRSGCISNMTLNEYYKAEIQKDRSYIITVKNQKTAATSGPAM